MTRGRAGSLRSVEQAIHALASRQHGLVTRQQLLTVGVAPGVIERRVGAGRLRPLHRGVYLAGPVATRYAKEMAACLACGPSAVVSDRSAATLWQLPGRITTAVVEVIVRGSIRRRPGIRVRRVRTLTSVEITAIERIPVTTPARTLFDLAASVAPRELERALAEALARRLTREEEIRTLLERHSGDAGARALQAVFDAGQPAFTRSEAEERFLALARRAQLPAPESNVDVAGHKVDFFWRRQRLVVDIDVFAFHSSPRAFERDRRRDAVLAAAGMRVVRVTWRQMADESEAVLVRLAQALVLAAQH